MQLGVLWAQVPMGPYISVWKLVPVVLVLLVWARAMNWVDKDSPAAHLPRYGVNVGLLGAGVLGFILFFALPSFGAGFAVLLGLIVVSFGVYLGIRKQKVGLADLKGQFKNFIRGMGGKPKAIEAPPGDVLLMDRGNNPVAAPEADNPGRPAYDALQQILTDPLRRNAQRIEMTPGEGSSHVEFFVDGFGYSGLSLNRSASAGAVTYLKSLAGMDINDKRKPQRGGLKVTLDGKRREIQIDTRGGVAGESMSIRTDAKTRHSLALGDLGMGDDQLSVLKGEMGSGGVVLVATPGEQGLTSLLYAIVRAHDAFLSHIITIERAPDTDLEGVTQDKLARNASNADEAKRVAWIASQQPDVLMCSEVLDPKSAHQLIEFADDSHRVYVGMRAPTTFDAVNQWRKLVGDDRLAAKRLRMVLAGRVARKLCSACKVGYSPDPATLRKMNMDPDVVGKLFQARSEPVRDAKGNAVPCDFCHDLRFVGRTGFFEILRVDDEVRQVMATGGSVNQLKALFRKQRGKYLQERALEMVEKGETSIQEVLRVLKSGSDANSANRPSPAAAPKASRTKPAGQ